MSKFELPEGFIDVNDFHFTAESVVFVEPDAARRRMIVKAAQFAPAMAEEIKRLRELTVSQVQHISELLSDKENLAKDLEHRGLEIHAFEMQVTEGAERIAALQFELEALRQSPATREDRAFQIVQAYCANPNYRSTPAPELAEWALIQVDAMLAALSKPKEAEETDSFAVYKAEFLAWMRSTFPSQPPEGRIAHLKREVVELENAPKDGSELADCFSLLVGIADDQGVDLLEEARKKLAINKTRTWGKPNDDGSVSHVKPVTRRPFDLEAALRGGKVVTRSGDLIDEGTFKYVPYKDGYLEITLRISGVLREYDRSGKYMGSDDDCGFDLFMEGGV